MQRSPSQREVAAMVRALAAAPPPSQEVSNLPAARKPYSDSPDAPARPQPSGPEAKVAELPVSLRVPGPEGRAGLAMPRSPSQREVAAMARARPAAPSASADVADAGPAGAARACWAGAPRRAGRGKTGEVGRR